MPQIYFFTLSRKLVESVALSYTENTSIRNDVSVLFGAPGDELTVPLRCFSRTFVLIVIAPLSPSKL